MGNIQIQQYVVGIMKTNCYVVSNATTKECIVIDPGASGIQLVERIRQDNLQPVAVLLTHGHFDHAAAAETVAQACAVPVYAHEAERDTLQSPEKNVGSLLGTRESYHADVYLTEGEISLAGLRIQVLHTPGHTEGGCCYYLPDEGVLFSGDTLFAGSVGRTDFPGGSMSQIVRSVRDKILVLSKPGNPRTDITVYPGHNDITTIETERKNNPYL